MRDELEPTIRQERTGQCEPHDVFTHPAYGSIVISHPTGGDRRMFGSEVGHMGVVRIAIHKAEMHRDLSSDWIFSGDLIAEVEMTHSQFAAFITSAQKGSGTPCTLRAYAKTPAQMVAEIGHTPTKQEQFHREIRESASRTLEDIRSEIGELEKMLEGGSISKTKLKEIVRNLKNTAGNAPGNMEFVVQSAEKALEAATDHAKIEVEAFIDVKARQLGLQSLTQLAQIGADERSALPNGAEDE